MRRKLIFISIVAIAVLLALFGCTKNDSRTTFQFLYGGEEVKTRVSLPLNTFQEIKCITNSAYPDMSYWMKLNDGSYSEITSAYLNVIDKQTDESDAYPYTEIVNFHILLTEASYKSGDILTLKIMAGEDEGTLAINVIN